MSIRPYGHHLCRFQIIYVLWQWGYHDRVIRGLDELKSIIRYISENPMRWSQKMNDDSLL